MQFSRIFLVAALTGPIPQIALADPAALAITIRNSGEGVVECGASIAHWFSEDIGRIAPGESLSVSFGYDLATGTVFRLNETGDEMAVQRVWCGDAGRAWESRAEIPLVREAGKMPPPLSLDCAIRGGKAQCEAP